MHAIQLFKLGLTECTWRTEESLDFIELANALVSVELHQNLDIVQTNSRMIYHITQAWSLTPQDIFSTRDKSRCYNIDELIQLQQYVWFALVYLQ